MSADWYRVDGQALTYGEYWHMAPDALAFLITAARKFLGNAFQFHFSIAHPRLYHFLDEDEVPPEVRRRWQRLADHARREGFEPRLCSEVPCLESHRACFGRVLLGDGNRVTLTIAYVRNQGEAQTALLLASKLDDGLIVSTVSNYGLKPLPDVESVLMSGASLGALLDRHRRRLARFEADGRYAAGVAPAQLPGLIRERELLHFDFHVNRGVYVPMTEDEIAAAQEE
jgi:hypothetical protein